LRITESRAETLEFVTETFQRVVRKPKGRPRWRQPV
jgi:hypothetical protein